MTTTYTFKYYDVYTTKHEGTFPHVYWASEPVAVYGCAGLTAHLKLYPIGDNGYVSAFVVVSGGGPNMIIEAKATIHINTVSRDIVTHTIGHEGCNTQFGVGSGKTRFCDLSVIFREPKSSVGFSLTVIKITEKQGINETTTQPAGLKEYKCFSANAAAEIEKQQEDAKGKAEEAKQQKVRRQEEVKRQEEAKRQQQAELQIQEAKRQEEEKRKEESKRQAAEEAKQQADEAKRQADEARQQEETKRQEEAKRRAKEVKRQESAARAEALFRQVEEAMRQEEANRQEAKRQEAEEAKRQEAEEAKRQEAEEAKRQIEVKRHLKAKKQDIRKQMEQAEADTDAPPSSPPSKRTRSSSSKDDVVEIYSRNDNEFICPITRKDFVDPVKNDQCGHIYSSDAIHELLSKWRPRRKCPCPVAGCPHAVSVKSLQRDKHIVQRMVASKQSETKRKKFICEDIDS